MIRIILFLVLVAALALGVAWIVDQSGEVVVSWNIWRIETSLPVFILAMAIVILGAIAIWAILRGILKGPERFRRFYRERRQAQGRLAITQGLIAVGTGDHFAARRNADIARRIAYHDPLSLLLRAQAAQMDGDRSGAERAFRAMAEREDTRLLGLRGLFIEAQRDDNPLAAAALAQEALKIAPASAWASHAVLGFYCSRGEWDGALKILENGLASGLIDPEPYKRQRGVLLTARAFDFETRDRELSRASAMEAVKCAPTLVPAAALASKYLSESNQARRAMRILETAWIAHPHPDLAEAYAHVRLGDSARERLTRVELLAAKTPGHLEGALAVARAAIDASEFARARAVLAPFIAAPTQRVAILMAELERAEHGDDGHARSWMLRAVRAALDPAWTADGYVSDRWRPVSPVTGRIDAFQWLTPVSALPSDKVATIESGLADEPALSPAGALPNKQSYLGQNYLPHPSSMPPSHSSPAAATTVPPPVFRPRSNLETVGSSAAVPPVIPIIRAPDDPGVADKGIDDEFVDGIKPEQTQPGGWRGFLSRLVS